VSPRFLADLLAEARKVIGQTAEASAKVAQTVANWKDWLAGDPPLDEVNGRLAEARKLHGAERNQVWKLVKESMEGREFAYDANAKRFVGAQEGSAA
jgi:hypothetical protein